MPQSFASPAISRRSARTASGVAGKLASNAIAIASAYPRAALP